MRTGGVLNIFGKLLILLSLFLLTPGFWAMARKPIWRHPFSTVEVKG